MILWILQGLYLLWMSFLIIQILSGGGTPRGLVANVQDCDMVVREFEIIWMDTHFFFFGILNSS